MSEHNDQQKPENTDEFKPLEDSDLDTVSGGGALGFEEVTTTFQRDRRNGGPDFGGGDGKGRGGI